MQCQLWMWLKKFWTSTKLVHEPKTHPSGQMKITFHQPRHIELQKVQMIIPTWYPKQPRLNGSGQIIYHFINFYRCPWNFRGFPFLSYQNWGVWSWKWFEQISITLRIIGPSYRGVWICIAGFRDLQTPSFEIPWFLGHLWFYTLESGNETAKFLPTNLPALEKRTVSIWTIEKNHDFGPVQNALFSMENDGFLSPKHMGYKLEPLKMKVVGSHVWFHYALYALSFALPQKNAANLVGWNLMGIHFAPLGLGWIHPGRLTWNPENDGLENYVPFQLGRLQVPW